MRKSLIIAFICALALPLTADRAQAQFALLPYAGFNTAEGLGAMVGIGAEFDAPFAIGDLTLSVQPGIEYVFVDTEGLSYLQLDGNVLARFGAPGTPIVPYAGAGLGVAFVSSDDITVGGITVEGESSTDIGLNILGGVIFPGALGFGNPYGQVRYSLIGDLDALSIMAGIRIPLGAS